MTDPDRRCALCGEPMPAGEEMFNYHGYSSDCPKPPLPRPEKAMLKICIAIDDWKLPIFERHLSQAGYTYEKGAGLTPDTLHLYVNTDDLRKLEVVVRAANSAAAAGATK